MTIADLTEQMFHDDKIVDTETRGNTTRAVLPDHLGHIMIEDLGTWCPTEGYYRDAGYAWIHYRDYFWPCCHGKSGTIHDLPNTVEKLSHKAHLEVRRILAKTKKTH